MTTVRVEAPARLHLGMIDVAGTSHRRFGGLGLAVVRPAVRVEAVADHDLSVTGPDAERALAVARRCREALGLPGGARLRVMDAIPAHMGLGSGTKLALAVASALAALYGREVEPAALARAAGRSARSAVGLWTYALGGLVVEGGVRPGSGDPAPVLARHPMPPEWRCVLVIPGAEPGLSGHPEEEAFKRLTATTDHAGAIGQLVLTSLLPALVEQDLVEFGAAVTRVQRLVGESFASVQGGMFHPQSAPLVEALLRLGAAGVGQSSWGPAVYGFVGSEREGLELADRMRRMLGGHGTVELAEFDNRGAAVERR